MTKIYWCLTLAAIVFVMSSFSCSKPAEDVTMMRQETGNVTVDFTNFPARTVWTLYPEAGGAPIRFDSDSMKLYHANVPAGKYRIHWKLVNVTTDYTYQGKCSNGDKILWENGLHMYYGREITGTYTFVREKK